jgi:protein CMS1
VVAAAGILCADLTRALRIFEKSKDAPILKLFAKHQKLSEAADKLSKSRTPIVVGTPHRLLELMEKGIVEHAFPARSTDIRIGHLHTKAVKHIVLNASHIDQKKRGMLDMKEIFQPLTRLLARKEFKERYGESKEDAKVELLVY